MKMITRLTLGLILSLGVAKAAETNAHRELSRWSGASHTRARFGAAG